MLQLYSVQHCPVYVHCKSYEHPSHLCPVDSVDVADVAEGFDRVSIDDDAILHQGKMILHCLEMVFQTMTLHL